MQNTPSRRHRRGELSFGKIVGGLVLLVGGTASYILFPYYWSYLVVDDVCEKAAFFWASGATPQKSQQRLGELFRKREVPSYVDYKEDCELYEQEGELCVDCYWEVDVPYPLIEGFKTLSFEAYDCQPPTGD